jgi:hypothetical protein
MRNKFPDAGPIGSALFTDWTELHIDTTAADRLLAQVPPERADQLPFLTLMLEGLRAAVAEALEAALEEMRAELEAQRAELLALWQAALEGRRDLGKLIGILGGQQPATGAAGAPEPEPLAEPGESGEGP